MRPVRTRFLRPAYPFHPYFPDRRRRAAASARPRAARPSTRRCSTPLRWRSIGPANTGGRVADLAVARVPGLPDAIYVAHRERRHLQEHQPGHVVDAGLRPRRRDDVDRRHRRGALESQRRLGRHRRSRTTGRAPRGATASTDRSTADGRGRRRASPRRATSAACSFTRRIRTSCTSRPSAISGDRTANEASSRPPTAGRRGRRCSTSTTTPAPPISSWIRRILRRSSRRRTSASARRGASTAAVPAAASTARATAARTGRSCRAGCRAATRGASASTSSAATRASSTPSSRRRAARAASTAARTAATRGKPGPR